METIVIDIQARYQDKTKNIEQSTQAMDQFSRSCKKTEEQAVKSDQKLDKIWQTAKNIGKTAISIPVKILDYATKPLRGLFNFATSIKGIVTGLFVGATAQKLVKGPMVLADQLEGAKMFFEKKLGGTKKAERFLQEIYKFDEKSPFDTMQIIDITKSMMGVGWTQKDVLKDISTIGDASASLGLGTEGVGSIAKQLGQMKMKSKLSQEEINVLNERGINAWDYIAKGIGVSVAQARAMNEKKGSAIQGKDAVAYILQGMEKEYGGAAAGASDRTLSGLFDQLKSFIQTNVFLKWGEGLSAGAKKGLGTVKDLLDKNKNAIAKFGDSLKTIIHTKICVHGV